MIYFVVRLLLIFLEYKCFYSYINKLKVIWKEVVYIGIYLKSNDLVGEVELL